MYKKVIVINNKINKLAKDNYQNKWDIDNKIVSMTFCKIKINMYVCQH